MSEFIDDSYEQAPAKRPVFLTVLCILTFVSCGFGFLAAIVGIATSGAQDANEFMQQARPAADMPGMGGEMMTGMMKHYDEIHKWGLIGNYLAIANALICLAGALLMWKLKKSGFYIYCFGQVLPFITLVGTYSAMKDIPFMGFAMIIGSIFVAIFAIGFIIMYGVNLKHMRS